MSSSAVSATTTDPIAAVRSFNRFYTNVIGLLREGLLRTPYTLTEARVILPGAQALLGFQLSVVLTQAFEKLPVSSQIAHGMALGEEDMGRLRQNSRLTDSSPDGARPRTGGARLPG